MSRESLHTRTDIEDRLHLLTASPLPALLTGTPASDISRCLVQPGQVRSAKTMNSCWREHLDHRTQRSRC